MLTEHRQCVQNSVRSGHTHTHRHDGVCARPHLIRVYTHTPVAAEIILRHTAFFLELIGALRFREPGKAPGTKNESVPTLPLMQQEPHY